ncbi:MAG: YceI family protein [Anaerolineae bacterium]|jgi:polyisoprenoid-binding protein YceI|nr:YceI family protein [Anaerolineae bacterium]
MATWNLDTAHTSADFAVKHMMFATVRGSFSGISGVIHFDPANPAAAAVEATIPAASISTGMADRDNHLRSPDFLDVANHASITFKSKAVQAADASHATVLGDLTIRGVTREVTMEVDFLGTSKNPWGQQVAGFAGRTTINREDFGLTWNQVLEAGGVLVGKEIKIELNVEANPAA